MPVVLLLVLDWGAQHDLLPSANNGLDQQMEWVQDANKTRYGQPGFASTDFKAALANGSVPLARLDDMATRILTPMYALGLVDDPPAATHATTTVRAYRAINRPSWCCNAIEVH
jgi:beta-glucosidase